MENKKNWFYWVRLALYIISGAVVPFGFLCWRFNLFTKVSKTNIGIWGVLALIILFVFMRRTLKYLEKAEPEKYATQIISGVFRIVIPCGIIAMVCYVLKDNMTYMSQFMVLLTICELIAVVVNPLPQTAKINMSERAKKLIKMFWEGKDE